jgi:hypothetical protein
MNGSRYAPGRKRLFLPGAPLYYVQKYEKKEKQWKE